MWRPWAVEIELVSPSERAMPPSPGPSMYDLWKLIFRPPQEGPTISENLEVRDAAFKGGNI